MGDIKTAKREKERAAKWIRDLPMESVHALIDAMVLGDFDWREWLDTRPSGAFLNAAFTAAQYREELEVAY